MSGLIKHQTKPEEVKFTDSWDTESLSAWVNNLCTKRGWSEDHWQRFLFHEIDGQCIGELTPELLRDIGIAKVGHRLTILREIKKIHQQPISSQPMNSGIQELPAVLPTVVPPQQGQSYGMRQEAPQIPAPQVPVYMPGAQQSNYDINCFPTAAPVEHKDVPSQPVSQPQNYYEAAPPVTYTKAPTVNLQTHTQIVHQDTEQAADAALDVQQDVYRGAYQQQPIADYGDQLDDDDDFPNATNLEPVSNGHLEQMLQPQPTEVLNEVKPPVLQQQHVESQEQVAVEEEHPVVSQSTQEVVNVQKQQEVIEEEITKPTLNEPVAPSGSAAPVNKAHSPTGPLVPENQQQPRPSAWGGSSKLRIGAGTPSKLLVQTSLSNKRFTKNFRSPVHKKVPDGKMEELKVLRDVPPPQPGDILKGTVEKVVPKLGAFVDINGPSHALLTNQEGTKNFRIELNKSYWVMVKKVEDPGPNGKSRRIHLTSFLPGIKVKGQVSRPHPTGGTRQKGVFVNVGWYKDALLLIKRMRGGRGKKKTQMQQQLDNLFVLRHNLKVKRNQQTFAELDLTEIQPQEWRPEDVRTWFESFYDPEEQVPEELSQLAGKDLFELTPERLEQLGVTDAGRRGRVLRCVQMMEEQKRANLTQSTKRQTANNKTTNRPQNRAPIPPPPAGDSHYPTLGNQKAKRG